MTLAVVGAITTQLPAQRVSAQTSTLWGIDSCDTAQDLVPGTQSDMGDPQFIGRYLGPSPCNPTYPELSTSEVTYAESLGIKILLIYDPGRFGPTAQEGAQGTADAQAAIQAAQAAGAPPGTAIFRDVEVSDDITAAYIQSWYQTFEQSGSGFVPAFYENSYNTTIGFFAGATGAYCTAEAADPALATGLPLWSDELEPNYGDGNLPGNGTLPNTDPPPVWNPYALPCANDTVAWQYEIQSGFPQPNPAPDVDVDLFLSTASSLLWDGDTYNPLTPFRVCDTRQGSGTPCSGQVADNLIQQGQSLGVQVTGISGPLGQSVPADADAVVLNVTAISGSAGTYLTVYPTGSSPPTTSNLNVPIGVNQANLAVVPLGSGGQVSVYNAAGAVNVAVDVEGYFAPPAAGSSTVSGLFHPMPPLRVCDTRPGTDTACSGTPLGAGQWTRVVLSGCPTGSAACPAAIPANGTAEAAALNLTAVSGTAFTYLSVVPPSAADTCPTGPPSFSNLNVNAQTNLPNRVIVPLGPAQDVCVYNSLGSINVILDVNGWFGTGAESSPGAYFHPVAPLRLCDTRSAASTGYSTECSGSGIGAGQSLVVPVAGVDELPQAGSSYPPVAVVANVTAVSGTNGTYFTVYPAGETSPPTASDLNVGPQQNTPNLVIAQLGSSGPGAGGVDLYNDLGTINAIVDVQGWFQ
jgi:hypothetical protein